MAKIKKSKFSEEQRDAADAEIRKFQKQIDYDTKDYTVEYLVEKLGKGDFFIPTYQRKFIWKRNQVSLNLYFLACQFLLCFLLIATVDV